MESVTVDHICTECGR